MRGNYPHEIRADRGTCGGCEHFVRGKNGDYPSAAGTCAVKPGRWTYSQRTPACKKHYKERRSNNEIHSIQRNVSFRDRGQNQEQTEGNAGRGGGVQT